MNNGQIVAAWNGKTIPDGLNENDRLAYIMLRAIYREYRAGVISQQDGEQIKDYLTRYTLLGQGERASLLQYAFTFLCARAGAGDTRALADSKTLAAAYHAMTGREIVRPHISPKAEWSPKSPSC